MSFLVVPSEFTRAGNTTHTGEKFPIPDDEKFSYGTAGFRFDAKKLPFLVFRCAYVASLRARQLNSAIGVMITASHNPEEDNGVKLVDPSGDMLNGQWEKYATEIVNASDAELPSAVAALEKQMSQIEKSFIARGLVQNARVVCGMDTRVTGPHLMSAASQGSALFSVRFENIGVVSTPILHYIVKSHNFPQFANPTLHGYYTAIKEAFMELYMETEEPEGSRYQPKVIVDCANGVGAPRFRDLMKEIPSDYLEVEFRNENGRLNHQCGADFVKIKQELPENFDGIQEPKSASFDGDADRLIYFRSKKGAEKPRAAELFDGDKIACLYAMYIQEQLKAYHETKPTYNIDMGIVQTAYANGASTRFIRDTLKMKPIIVKTGVKYLHEEASEFDIGIYFEANGHGTVVFSSHFDSIIRRHPQTLVPLRRLALFSRVINETVGDAFADLLAVEICLRHYGWSMDDWAEKLYRDVPSHQVKVDVAKREDFETTNAEQTLVKPIGLQEEIDKTVAKYKESRAFVRPSGTENIVRVYAEADTLENAIELGETLKKIVLKY
uniref:Phosphoacetylglucosamine mutase n=1 Tax=Caenorhabditis tropicalis TaxID=1561998 RepID=A0A1I7TPH3_9PELO